MLATNKSQLPLFLAVLVAVLTAAAVALVAPPKDAGAAWAWCRSDPRFDLTATNANGDTVKGTIEVDAVFPAEFLDQIKDRGFEVKIQVPHGVDVYVDPDSLVAYLDGVPMPGLMNISAEYSHGGGNWDGEGPVRVRIAARLRAHHPQDIPLQLRVAYQVDGQEVVEWHDMRANKKYTTEVWMSLS